MFYSQFKNKKIAVIGASVEGVSSLKFFTKHGARVVLCDQKEPNKFSPIFLNDIKKKQIEVRFGKDYLDGLDKFDLVVRTPGFPLWNQKLVKVINQGVIVTSQTKILFDLCKGRIIGVTGTKGKGTTATLIYRLLKEDGKKVFLGGNIGTPPFSFLNSVDSNSWVVLELSSFQLSDLTKSPHIAVVLNITSDHLYSASFESPNYHLSQREYIQAKTNILRFQRENDFAVINRDYQSSYRLARFTKGDVWFFSKKRRLNKGAFVFNDGVYLAYNDKLVHIIKTDQIQLRGSHNLENVVAAVTAAFLAGVKDNNMSRAISNFKGLEHRLEFVRSFKNRQFYNDSFSTTPETTIAAIKSFAQNIVLICGGSEKKSDYTQLGEEIIKGKVVKVILIGTTALKIQQAIIKAAKRLKKDPPVCILGLRKMKDIVNKAFQLSNKGEIVLLSPACASFDMFSNYKERGRLFKEEVNKLQ